jgi:hypothetical protein
VNPNRWLARRERLRFHDGILPSQKRSQMIPGSNRSLTQRQTDLGERPPRTPTGARLRMGEPRTTTPSDTLSMSSRQRFT